MQRKLLDIVFVFLAICVFQSLFYPFILAPGATISWWQIGFLANIGFLINFPALLVWEVLPNTYYQIEIYWTISAINLLALHLIFSKTLHRALKPWYCVK